MTSSSSFRPAQKPLLHQMNKPIVETVRRSLSNMSLSSRYSYDNIADQEDHVQETLPSLTDPHHHSKAMKRIYMTQHSVQADNVSTNSSATLRTDSYRQAHPLQSFAFDYPKRPLLPQSRKSTEHDNQPRIKANKHYEISVWRETINGFCDDAKYLFSIVCLLVSLLAEFLLCLPSWLVP